ncbi:MAG TPA: TolC family protein [Burkholderiales bacterium]|jgi:outer membrane protein TolC|nr:TolC family protein [Burkholderiales bacterium]
MKKGVRTLFWLTLVPLHAALAANDELPREDAVRSAVESSPAVLAARAGVEERQAAARALEAGTYELNLRLSADRRREEALDRNLPEYALDVERPFRSGRKAQLDAELGRQGVVRAKLAVGDAIHEASRELLRAWFEWLRAAAQGRDWQAQADLLQQQLDVVDRRVRRGDAPRQERILADSAFEQASSQAMLAQARAGAAAVQLTTSFPGIPVPDSPPVVALTPLAGDAQSWRDRVVEHNHELAVARAEAKRLQIVAARADANRLPDPALGARLSSERDGAEKTFGLSFAMPLPGEARAANAQGAGAESRAATQREAVVLRRLEAQTGALYTIASRSYEAARRAESAAAGLQRNAELTERAYALGEVSLADVIAARRIAVEARLAATLASLDAAEARYRLMLDAHELWAIDSD